MKVRWLRRAVRSLDDILGYIANQNPKAAYKTLLQIRASAESLAHMPYMGRQGRVETTREMVVQGTPYVLAYRMLGEEIHILHVLHEKR